jgi:hypothetical protein
MSSIHVGHLFEVNIKIDILGQDGEHGLSLPTYHLKTNLPTYLLIT